MGILADIRDPLSCLSIRRVVHRDATRPMMGYEAMAIICPSKSARRLFWWGQASSETTHREESTEYNPSDIPNQWACITTTSPSKNKNFPLGVVDECSTIRHRSQDLHRAKGDLSKAGDSSSRLHVAHNNLSPLHILSYTTLSCTTRRILR